MPFHVLSSPSTAGAVAHERIARVRVWLVRQGRQGGGVKCLAELGPSRSGEKRQGRNGELLKASPGAAQTVVSWRETAGEARHDCKEAWSRTDGLGAAGEAKCG